MADVTHNYKVEIKRLQLQIKQQEAAIDREELGILEMADKVHRSRVAIDAAKEAISRFQENLLSLETEHGELTQKDIKQAFTALEE